jgi:hypothetical protein
LHLADKPFLHAGSHVAGHTRARMGPVRRNGVLDALPPLNIAVNAGRGQQRQARVPAHAVDYGAVAKGLVSERTGPALPDHKHAAVTARADEAESLVREYIYI